MAARKNRYGFQEYRGRGSGRSVLIFIVVLLAVLFIAGVVFLFAMGDYINYTPDGLEINWPWRDKEPSALPEITDPVVPASDDPVVTGEPTQEPTPTLPPEPVYEPIAAVTVTTGQLLDGTAVNTVANAGGNAMVVEMKADSGKLAWQSQTELAATLNANAESDDVADAIRELALNGDIYLVARVHCFKDPGLVSAGIGALLSTRDRVWYDLNGAQWSSPANQQAADYLSALCLELSDMGFDEILLDDAGYPCQGDMNALANDDNRPGNRTVPVAAFIQRIAGELKEKGVRLSVYAYEKLLTGDEVYSGMTASVLAQNAGRVWLDKQVSREHYESILSVSGLDNVAARVVASAANAGEGGSWYR